MARTDRRDKPSVSDATPPLLIEDASFLAGSALSKHGALLRRRRTALVPHYCKTQRGVPNE
jgi:hypothetical protein